jgi:hypothetical protein
VKVPADLFGWSMSAWITAAPVAKELSFCPSNSPSNRAPRQISRSLFLQGRHRGYVAVHMPGMPRF